NDWPASNRNRWPASSEYAEWLRLRIGERFVRLGYWRDEPVLRAYVISRQWTRVGKQQQEIAAKCARAKKAR
ncbi:MAG: hypothetical protein EOR43_15650, partial [Mesorhizobium sp.]